MNRHRIIRASAGTGKTHQLALRFVELLNDGAQPTEILASTFTVRAAGEIRDRVLGWLARAVDDESFRNRLNGQLAAPLDERRARELLRECARGLHRLQISTLDSFFSRIARSFSLELGLPGSWRIGEQHELEDLRALALSRLLDRAPATVVEWVRLLEKGDSPRSVWSQLDAKTTSLHALYLESDESAWTAPMETAAQRDWNAHADALERESQGQANSIAKCMLADAEHLRAPRPDFAKLLGKGIAAKLLANETSYNRAEIPDAVMAVYEDLAADVSRDWARERSQRTRVMFRLLEAFDVEFQRSKIERSLLGFDDLPRVLALSALLARMDDIWYRLDRRVTHLLLDEFQDTSRLQWNVLAPLAHEALSREDKSLFAVGDLKQAIYRWRGAEPRILLALQKEAERAGAQTQRLDLSYRSAPEILEAVDRVFDGLAQLPALENARNAAEQWRADYATPKTAREELAGEVWMHGVELRSSADRRAIAQATIELAQRLLGEAKGSNVAILVRTHQMLAHLRHECIHRGIPLSEEGGTRLDQYPAPQLLLSLARLAEHPGDRVAAFHLLHSPLAAVLELDGDERSRSRASRKLRAEFLLDGFARTLWRYTHAISKSLRLRTLRMIEQLLQSACVFDQSAGGGPGQFVRFIEARKVEDPLESPLRVLTVFGAKGLQFQTVILCDLDRKMLSRAPDVTVHRDDPLSPPTRIRVAGNKIARTLDPNAQADHRSESDERIKEELSLLYVAMTRAEEGLHFVTGNRSTYKESCAAIIHQAFGAPDENSSRLLIGEPGAQSAEETPRRAQPRRAKLRLAAPSGRLGTLAQRPSDHGGASSVAAAERIRPRAQEALRRGRLLHAALACVGWSEDGLPETPQWLEAMREIEPDLGPRQLSAGLEEFRQLWPRLAHALSRGSYPVDHELELWRERAFAIRETGKLTRGRYDRVVLGRRDGQIRFAHVLDFKSDAREDMDASQLAELYRSQMESYARAIQTRCELPRAQIRLSLLWSTTGELVDIDP